MSDYKIRKLTRKDRKTLTGIIKKFVSATGDKSLLSIFNESQTISNSEITEKEKNDSMISLGISLLDKLIDVLDEDMAMWFADLIGVDADKFDECPIDIDVTIIDQIVSSKEISDFFSGVSQISNTIAGFGRQSNQESDK